MRFVKSAAAAAAMGLACASPAQADRVFLQSSGLTWSLILNGGTVIQSFDTGMVGNQGEHVAPSTFHIVGGVKGGTYYHNFGVFDLADVVEPIASATLAVNVGGVSLVSPYSWTLFDVSTSYATLNVTRSADQPVGEALFADLGSGMIYGSFAFEPDTPSGTQIAIALNADGLDAIRRAAGSEFIIGGRLIHAAIPEPSTWAMLILGFGLVGGIMRARSRSTLPTSH